MAAPDLPPEILALLDRLRTFIRTSVPEAEERVYKGGTSMGYHARGSAFCGLFSRPDAVYLAFTKGDLLPDPAGLLVQSQGRYAVLRPGDDLPEDALFHLLVAALLVGGDHPPGA